MNEQAKLIYTTRMPVRWGDMDAYNHVNNTVYFRYLEQTRVEWLEQIGCRVSPDEPIGPVIINAACTFFAPGILWPSTSTRSPRVPITPPPTPSPSHTLVQNCSGCATDQACSAS